MAATVPVNVLIVDDNPAQRLSLSALLRDLDLDIIEAASGRDALRHLLKRDFALILLDVNMPGLDGFETAALIRSRERSQQTPIIFVTANGDDAHAARGYSLRAVDFILAPVQPEVLRTKVTVLIDLYRKTAEVTRHREALWRYANQLQQLSRASLAINSTQSVEAVLQTMTDSAAQIIGTHHAITVAALKGTPPFCVTHHPSQSSLITAELDQVLRSVAACEMQGPLRIHDGAAPPPLAPLIAAADAAPRDWLAAPLQGPDGGFGLIQLADKDVGNFTAEDEDILVQLTQMASIAIGNIVAVEAREANRLKDEFLSVLSHELRTPLQAMLTWLSILRRDNVPPDTARRGLDVIERSARAQAQLIEDLLDISRIIRGQFRLESRSVDLSSVIDLALEPLRPAAAEKMVHIDFVQPSGPCRIIGDPARLQQVVWNLVANAIKFTPGGGRVEVSLAPGPACVCLTVTDTGPGIPNDFLPHVFERFRQADSSARRSHGGLGLGLAIVRHLIDLHGGGVQAENVAGAGARFTVSLPRADQASAFSVQSDPGAATLPPPAAPVEDGNVNGISLDGNLADTPRRGHPLPS